MIKITGLMFIIGFVFVALFILFDTHYITKYKIKTIIEAGICLLGIWLCVIGIYYIR